MICQLAISYAPDQLLIVGAVRDRAEWDWLKWLPHNQHPSVTDLAGSARMVYPAAAEARDALAAVASPHALVILDAPATDDIAIVGATVIRVGRDAASLMIRHSGGQDVLEAPDYLGRDDAVVCARRVAAHAVTSSRDPTTRPACSVSMSTRPRCGATKIGGTASVSPSAPPLTASPCTWTSKRPPSVASGRTGSASGRPDRVNPSCCVPSRWA